MEYENFSAVSLFMRDFNAGERFHLKRALPAEYAGYFAACLCVDCEFEHNATIILGAFCNVDNQARILENGEHSLACGRVVMGTGDHIDRYSGFLATAKAAYSALEHVYARQ